MTKRYFTYVFLIFYVLLLAIPIFSSSLSSDVSKTYFYKEEINLGINNLPEETFHLNLKITSENRTLFDKDFIKEDALNIPFRFEEFFPNNLTIIYSFYSIDNKLLEKKEFPLLLTTLNQNIDVYFCKESNCKTSVQDVFIEEENYYLSSSLKNTLFTVNIKSEDFLKEYKEIPFPLLLNLKEGVYSIEVLTKLDTSLFSQTLDVIVISKEESISQNQDMQESLSKTETTIQGNFSQNIFQKIKNTGLIDILKKYWYVILIIIMIFFIIFKKRKKDDSMTENISKNTKNISRREARKMHVFIILFSLIIFSNLLSASLTNKEYEYSFFTDDYNIIFKNFPKENEISLYLTDIKPSNSYFFPIINHTNESFKEKQTIRLYEGIVDYKPLSVLFAVDLNKSVGNYAPFLPKDAYSSYCEPILDYFKRYPITTKADLINRNRTYLTTSLGFSKECVDELLEKRWLQEKEIISEIKYTPFNYNNQSKIIQTEIIFKSDLFSKEFILPINIIKTDSAVVYAYPDPVNYNNLRLEIEENGWILSNKISHPIRFADMEEVFRFSLNDGRFGGYIYTLENYNNKRADFKIKYLDSEKEIIFNDFLSSNYFSIKDENLSKDVIVSVTNRNGNLVLSNYQLNNISENRQRKFSISPNTTSQSSKVISRRELSLLHYPQFDKNSFSLSLTSGAMVKPIVKDDLYLFYNFDVSNFRKMNLYLVKNLENQRFSFKEAVADYSLSTNRFVLENDFVRIDEIYSSKQYTSFFIFFKEENSQILISTDRKNIISTQDPNFYIYKDYFIVTLDGNIRIYKNKTGYVNKKENTYGDYDNKLFYLSGREAIINNQTKVISGDKIKLFNSYIYDISTAQDFSLTERKLFWANSFKKINLDHNNWFLDSNFDCNLDISVQDFNSLSENLKKMNFTILKYPESYNMPFSMVLSDTRNYVIPRNTFSRENYNLICAQSQDQNLGNYSKLILNSAEYLKDQNNFIEQLSFFQRSISQTFPNTEKYSATYLNQHFTSSREGIIFIDENGFISGAASLDFRNDYASSIDFFANYLVFDRLSIFSPDNLTFSKERIENENIRRFIKDIYITPKEKLTLKFKLPKRNPRFTDAYIYRNFINTGRTYSGNCTALSLDVAGNYRYNTVRNFSLDNNWWGSDFRREDAWFLVNNRGRIWNQVIWDYRHQPPVNPNKFFEGMILGIYIGKTSYTYKPDHPDPSKAGKTFTGLLYTHTAPYIENYRNNSGMILNAGFYVSAEEAVEYYTESGRQLRQIIVPLNYYDNTIRDKYNKTELDYVREYLTSFN